MGQQGGIGGEVEPTGEKDKPKPEQKPKPKPRPMPDCMMRKLALWYTRNFKPLLTHDELEPILATLGFVSLPPSSAAGLLWKEYLYSGRLWRVSGTQTPPPLPRARLPFPRIDGLHINTYRAFLDAVNFFLEMSDISDLFHVRGLPLDKNRDRNRWQRMEEDENTFVYREGTLDQATSNLYRMSNDSENSGGNYACYNSVFIGSKIKNTPTGDSVPLSNITDLGLPLDKNRDKNRWQRMEEDENTFVYREGTLDQATSNLYRMSNDSENSRGNYVCYNSVFIGSKIKNIPTGDSVPLSNITDL